MKNISVILLLIFIPFIFSSCLTIPINPTARVTPRDCIQSSYGIYHTRYDYTYYNYYSDTTEYAKETVDLNFILLEARSSLGLDNVDFGLGYNGYYISGDVKFSPLDQRSSILFAIDGSVFFDFAGDVGGGAGFIINFAPNKNFELILAVYELYMIDKYKSSYSSSSTKLLMNGFNTNFYTGLEWHVSSDFTISVGAGAIFIQNEYYSYSYYDSYYGYSDTKEYEYSTPIYFGLTVKWLRLTNPSIAQSNIDNIVNQAVGAADSQSYLYLSEKYINLKDYTGAENILLEGLARYPDDYNLNKQMGNVQYFLKNPKLAIYFYEKALSIKPNDYSLRNLIDKLKTKYK